MWSSSDVVLQLRIDLSVLAYSPCQQNRSSKARLKSYNRIRKKYGAMPIEFSDIKKNMTYCRNGYLVSQIFRKCCGNDGIGTGRIEASLIRSVLIEEPWLGQSAIISHSVSDKIDEKLEFFVCYDSESQKKTSPHDDSLLSYSPVEEPWILDTLNHMTPMPNEQNNNIVDDLVHEEEENHVVPVEEPVSTVILINSSICTMQRIAVLENDKLVELLLEPVKSNVQCDSVYLGLLSKLVPQMGGAFVNIGSSRLSFMDLNPNREPFIFLPFSVNLKEMDGSSFDSSASQMDVSAADIVEELDDVDDDQNEDERSSHFDLLKIIINGNVNGMTVGSGHESDQEISLAPSFEDSDQLQTENSKMDAVAKVRGLVESFWAGVRNGTRIIVQVVKEGLGTKGPTVTAYPKLRSRFWVLSTRCNTVGISKKITGVERTRLKAIAKTLQPPGFGLTLRTVASSHTLEELKKDLEGLLSTWKSIVDHAKSAAIAADEGVEGAVPVMLHRAMDQTLSVVQDYFNDKVEKMVVDSSRNYHEVTKYLQDIDPNLCSRVELYSKQTPLFDEYNIEDEIDSILQKRVPLVNGGYLVIEQTEALVSIDVNGGHCMLGEGTSQEKAILEVNLVAAKQIARELRLRDIGGIIVVDFIDMEDDSNKRLVYEEVKKAVEKDRSNVKVSELSKNGLMEITRKRVRPSVSFMISEPCSCCNATGRVEALETLFSKIEHEICRLLSIMEQKADPEKPKSWPRFILRVDRHMCTYLTSGKKTRLAVLSSSLKVWILIKVARGLARGAFELKALTEGNAHHKKQHHTVAMSVLRPKEVVTIKKWKTNGK